MGVRVFDSQGGIEPDSSKGCHYLASFHRLVAVAVAFDVAVAQSVHVAVSAAAVVGRPAAGRPVAAAGGS